jgi:hypothetical protein
MQIFSILDLPGLIHLSKTIGLNLFLTTRKETHKYLNDLGKRFIPTWGNRALMVDAKKGAWVIGGGIIHRFIVDLKTPSQFIHLWAKE